MDKKRYRILAENPNGSKQEYQLFKTTKAEAKLDFMKTHSRAKILAISEG